MLRDAAGADDNRPTLSPGPIGAEGAVRYTIELLRRCDASGVEGLNA